MKKLIIFLTLTIFSVSYSQTKYLIYFKDKGISSETALTKSSLQFQKAANSLSERSIERRKKTLGENFITFQDIPIKKDYLKKLKNLGIKIENKLKWFNAASAYLTEEEKNKISSLSFIKKIEPVHILSFDRNKIPQPQNVERKSLNKISKTNIDYGNSFTQLNLIGVPEVHSKGINGKGVLIGILDSGFRWKTHEALKDANVIAEHDFVFNDNNTANESEDVSSQDSHGTHVFSMVGGYDEGEMIGPAFGASFVLAKTEDIRSETHVEEDNYAAALEWMDSIGVDITTSSLGYSEFDAGEDSYTYEDMNGKTTIVTKAAEFAFQRGITLFTAAGNEGDGSWHYIVAPADGFNVIAVGAVDNSNQLASFSSRGPTFDGRIKPDITAQGVNVYGAVPGGGYNFGNGTSFATPIAAGTGALLLSAFPYLTNSQLREILIETAGNFKTPNNNIGYGLVSASKIISFPNIELRNGKYFIHKIFLKDRINPQTIHINYFDNSDYIIPESFSFNDSLKYEFEIPVVQAGQEVQFYFTFADSSGNNYREPASDNYTFNYGELNITIKTEDIPPVNISFEGTFSNPYPNPFLPAKNPNIKINFKSPGNENLQAVIVNTLGEKLKSYNLITRDSNSNLITWNGISDNGIECPSGIYLFLINLNGKLYSKKMVLLR